MSFKIFLKTPKAEFLCSSPGKMESRLYRGITVL